MAMVFKNKEKLFYNGVEVVCILDKYTYNNSDAIVLIDAKEMVDCAVATICVDIPLVDGAVVIKDYSENEGMYQWLLDNNIVTATNQRVQTGFVSSPVCIINKELFEETEI